MNNYNEEIHYDELVKENILIAKTLANLPELEKGKVKKLFSLTDNHIKISNKKMVFSLNTKLTK